jgi:hypothetical protein
MPGTTKILLAFALVLVQVCSLFAGSVSMAPETAQPALKWRSRVITIALSTSLQRPAPNVKYGSDLLAAVRRSMQVWEDAAAIEFKEVISEKQNVSQPGSAGDGISLITIAPTAENALLFGKGGEEAAATTRIFYDARGRISEADIVLNPYQQFSADGTFGTFDLESTLTHEIGHLLGLEHSAMRSSTMYENFGKNGLFGLQSYSHRTLSEPDRSVVRAKYGPSETDGVCCGSVSAKLQFPDGRPASNVEIWLEDSNTGKVAAQSLTGADGTIEIGGLPYSNYALYSSRRERLKRTFPVQLIGTVDVTPSEAAQIVKKLEPGHDDLELKYTGFNGQLTLSQVPINAGRGYTVYLGGRNLNPKNLSIKFSSPFLQVTPGSVVSHDYGAELSVVSFEVLAEAGAPVGEYTVFVESASGGRSAVVGGLSIRAFSNPYSNLVLDTKSY